MAKMSCTMARKSRMVDFWITDQLVWPSISHTRSNIHPRRSTTRQGRDDRPGPVGRRAALGAPPWCRSGSRRPKAARGDRRGVPIPIWGSGRSRRGRGPVLFLRGGGGGRSCRWGRLGKVFVSGEQREEWAGHILCTSVLGDSDGYCERAWATSL